MRATIDQVRALSDERLHEEEFNTRLEVLNLRFKIATRQLTGASELHGARRRLAHLLPVLRERDLIGGTA